MGGVYTGPQTSGTSGISGVYQPNAGGGPGSWISPGQSNFGLGGAVGATSGNFSTATSFLNANTNSQTPFFSAAQDSNWAQASSQSSSNKGNVSGKKKNPTKRPQRELRRASGEWRDEKKGKDLRAPPSSADDEKGMAQNLTNVMKHLGLGDISNEDQESGGGAGGGLTNPGNMIPSQGGIPQEIAAAVPGMQQLLQDLPQNVLGNFMNNIPGQLQSLVPNQMLGALGGGLPNLAGLFNGPVSLNSLMQLAGGGALGSAGNEIMRSLMPAVSSLQGLQALSSVPLGQVFPSSQTSGTGTAAFSQAMSTVQSFAASAGNLGIPVDAGIINQAVSIALAASGIAQSPAAITGILNGSLGNVIGAALGGQLGSNAVPVIPNNLSNGMSSALLSGMSQFLPPQVAQQLFNIGQVTGMLPQNIRNLIPQVNPKALGGAPNAAEQAMRSSPQQSTSSPKGNSGGCNTKPPYFDGKIYKNSTAIDYDVRISPNYTLAKFTTGAYFKCALDGTFHCSVEEKIRNLSALAVNCIEPIREAFPGFIITSGYRGKGRATENSDHGWGRAADLQWSGGSSKVYEVARWAVSNLRFKQIIIEHFNGYVLHVAFDPDGGCQQMRVNTQVGNRYPSGIIRI